MKRTAKITVIVAVLAVMVLTLRNRIPAPDDIVEALDSADLRWLLVAAVAEFISMGMFARQQRRLLIAFGVTFPRHRMLALSYSRSAISISLPAGSAVSAGYAFRQFRAGGADRSAATAVMVLSGLLSTIGLVLLYASGALASGIVHLAAAWHTHAAFMATGVVVLLGGIVWLIHALPHHSHHPHRTPHSRLLRPLVEAFDAARSIAPRHWTLALGSAVFNWLTDLVCLVAAARGFGIDASLFQLATIYLTVQVVRQIPLTPGGIGVIEVSLLTGLVSAGAAEPAAAAAVLAYRLLSCWLIIPVGLFCWALLRGRSKVVDSALLDEEGTGELGSGLGEDSVPVAPRRDVREQQPARVRAASQGPRLLSREVHTRRPIGRVCPGRLRKQHVDAASELVEGVTGPGVTGVRERPTALTHP
jgi:uncharacterized protein (TIRG00374 family)